MQIMSFLTEFFFVFFALVGLGLIGGFAVIPFSKDVRYGIFLSPMTGLFISMLGVATLYSLLNLPVLHAFIGVAVLFDYSRTGFFGKILNEFTMDACRLENHFSLSKLENSRGGYTNFMVFATFGLCFSKK